MACKGSLQKKRKVDDYELVLFLPLRLLHVFDAPACTEVRVLGSGFPRCLIDRLI
jgi:hypothetical protein